MNTNQRLILFMSASLTLTACGRGNAPAAQQVAQASMKAVGCKVSQSEMWNGLQSIAESGGAFPSAAEVRASITASGQTRGLSGPKFDAYVDAFVSNYDLTITGIQSKLSPGDVEGWKKALAEMEAGVHPTDLHAELDAQIEASLKTLTASERALGVDCPVTETAYVDPDDQHALAKVTTYATLWEQLKATQVPEIYGARRVLATAYQSCDVMKLQPMTESTPNVAGIKVVGRHPSGGNRRQIASLPQLVGSDYYIKGQTLAKNSCFEVRNSPLIYDFGGKPYTSSQNTKVLDMFKNAGTGEAVLGIDCSAYVFSSLMAAGLKTDPSREMKGSLVLAYGSGAFKEPQSNNMKCLQKISVTKTASIAAGDIVAINGHVVMIDEVGADPFGLKKITKSADCTTAKLSAKNFDFVIAQSSPSKSGIGINRFAARDYLDTSTTIKLGLQAYAVAACRAQYGLAANLNSPSLSVVRHKRTAECKMAPLELAKQECTDSCRPL